MLYQIRDKLPFKQLMLFSTQMVLAVFVASTLIANICGVPVSGALVGAGLSTLTYLAITGFNSPMFMSNSGAFVAPVIAALSIGGFSGVLVGGITTAVIYCLFGLLVHTLSVDVIYKIFPKSLIGAVTAVIGINLMGFISTYLKIGDSVNMYGIFIAIVTMLATAIISHYAKGLFKIIPFLIGILIGYAVAVVLTVTHIFTIVDFSVFNNLTLIAMPDFAFMKLQPIAISTVLTIIITYLAYTISAICECLSDHAALGGIIGVDLYENPGLHKIFCGEGLANIVGSFFGGLGICSYGESVACIGFSKVAASCVTATAAVILIVLGFLSPVQAFIASIPSCVFAGAAMILYGYIACSGIKMLQKVDLNNQKDLIITSVVLSLGVCGIAIGPLSGTALALVAGIILNILLKEKEN